MLVRAWMQQVAQLRKYHNIEVVWVTSGAIASATERTTFKTKKRTLAQKQALSAIGQPLVMDQYNLALQVSGLLGAQVLLTYDDLANQRRRENFTNTMKQLLKWGVTPVLNENDAIATEEIKFGDNDSLSAKVAVAMQAKRLLILTDVDGLYDADPKKTKTAKLIHHLSHVSKENLNSVSSHAGSSSGTGGMLSKLLAAREATKNGIETWLVKGDAAGVLIRVAKNEKAGTRICKKN